MEWYRGKLISAKGFADKSKKALWNGTLKYYHGHKTGFNENDIDLEIGEDGHIHFFQQQGAEGYIYLYPEQVKLLEKLLAKYTN